MVCHIVNDVSMSFYFNYLGNEQYTWFIYQCAIVLLKSNSELTCVLYYYSVFRINIQCVSS